MTDSSGAGCAETGRGATGGAADDCGDTGCADNGTAETGCAGAGHSQSQAGGAENIGVATSCAPADSAGAKPEYSAPEWPIAGGAVTGSMPAGGAVTGSSAGSNPSRSIARDRSGYPGEKGAAGPKTDVPGWASVAAGAASVSAGSASAESHDGATPADPQPPGDVGVTCR